MVGFVKRFLGHLGFWKEENNERQQQQQHHQQNNHYQHQEPSVNNTDDTRQGFRMKVAMPTTETVPQGPVVSQCWGNDGGVQGFRWYAQKLQVDEDGDIAEEFLNEVLPNARGHDDSRELPRLELKHSTKPATLKDPVVSMNGNVHQCVEHAGKLRWA